MKPTHIPMSFPSARYCLLSIAFLGVLLTPSPLVGAPPQSVTGLSAELESNSVIRVRWTPLKDRDIAFYRVYYSHKSILNNDGYYDDYESTDGTASEYALKVPAGSTDSLFLAVMPVNVKGEEGTYFIEEVEVPLVKAPLSASSVSAQSSLSTPRVASSAASSRTSTATSAAETSSATTSSSPSSLSESSSAEKVTLRLLSAKALSPTEVSLEFTHPLLTHLGLVIREIAISDTTGEPLKVTKLTMTGETLTLETERQVARMVYEVRVKNEIEGVGAIPLDPIDRSAFFTGHPNGIAASSASSSSTSSKSEKPSLPPLPESGVPDVTNFTLEAIPQENRSLFTVIGRWEYDPRTPLPAYIIVRQSRDGGKTFGVPDLLLTDIEGVSIPNVTPENFGLAVYVVAPTGQTSPGIFRSIFAAITIETPVPPAPQIPQPPKVAIAPPTPPQSDALARSGGGFGIALLVLAGGLAGWNVRRHRLKKPTS